ncbi:MAG: hypothetical protein ORN58_05215, partial [Sediminibacterium sp.]|nr:hypothetical protein [Sediminibacterium sp.]
NKIINIYRKEIYLPAYESIIELQSEAQPIDLEPKNELPDTEPLEEVTEDNQEAAAEKKAETETEKIKYANKFLNSFNCSVNDIEKELMKLHISNLNDIQESRTYFGKESSGEFKKIIRDIFIVKNNTTADEFRNIIKTKAIDISNLLKNGNSFFVYNQIKETPKVNSELNIILEHTDRKKMMELWKDKLPQNIEYKIYSNNLLIYNSTDKKMVNPISLYKEFINPNSQNHYSDFTKFLLDNELTTYDKIDNAIKQNKILYLKNQPLNLDNYVINNIHQNKRLTSLGISQDTINDLKDVLKWGNNKQVLAKLDIDKQFFYLMYLYKNSENKVHYLELA